MLVRQLKSLPIQLILSIFAAFTLGSSLSKDVVALFYTASACFIDLLLFVLPYMVFSLIFLAISKQQAKSLQVLLFIFVAVFLSNFTALFTAYFFSSLTLPAIGVTGSSDFFTNCRSSIVPLVQWHLPTLLSSDKAMILAVILGLLWSRMSEKMGLKAILHRAISQLSAVITFMLNKIFIPLLPLYVFGFCLKLSYDQALTYLFTSYGKVFVCSMLLVSGYMLILYFLAAGGNVKSMVSHLKAMTPAGLTAFSTMSSAATMPITLQCTEKTTEDRDFTSLIIPTTSNIHMLGDDLTIVMTAMALLTMFGHPTPDLMSFTLFAAAFCVAKLSCVGVPGASVLVILPVLQNYLQFSPEMITVLTTIYILQDSFGTTANVMGNGAFALLIQRALGRRRAQL